MSGNNGKFPGGAASRCGITILILLAFAAPSTALADEKDWHSYTNSDYGFSLKYPDNLTLFSTGLDAQNDHSSYIPICTHATRVCLLYNGKEYEGTNFEAAALTVNVRREARTKSACDQLDAGSDPVKKTVINGTSFTYSQQGGAALSNDINSRAYRTFRHGVCFEVALSITSADIGAYDAEAIRAFKPAKLDRELDQVLRTFRFVGPVADGPAWRPYRNEMVGGSFEYPDGASVQKTIDYTNEDYWSDEITDEVRFSYQGFTYSVAAKVNIRDKGEASAWLKANGFPDLDSAQLVEHAEYNSEYKAGDYYYIYGESILYILSVSNDKGIIPPANAPLFRHFLTSFAPD